jgi:hypothetical protein
MASVTIAVAPALCLSWSSHGRRDGVGLYRGALDLNCPIEREEIRGIRPGFSQGKKRIGVLNACVTIVACKISADFRANSTLTAPKSMHFALRINTPP